MEILAPAGNMEALKTAVACGADAVYLGTKDFNARSKADNFSDEELRLAVSYCHERGVRVYLTLNTLIKTFETKSAIETVKKATDANVDAFLIQDLGLYLKLREQFPNVSFHTSTQMGVHNLPGAKFAEKLGFDRVVLSREVLAEDVAKIKKETELEIELFVHGAHCVSFSGNCYFSAMVSGYSGNRGKCLQLCRKKYVLSSKNKFKSGYMLSAKDINMLGSLGKLKELGVDSLKIEGRLKSPEYVGVVTDVYKRWALGQPRTNDEDNLKIVFNRGNFSQAYINDGKADVVYPTQQNHIGLRKAKIIRVSNGVIIPDKKFNAQIGDGYKILRNGNEVGSAYYAGGSLKYKGNVKAGDELHLTKSGKLAELIGSKIKGADFIKCEKIMQNTSKMHGVMSDIVSFPYSLPDKCTIAIVDEYTDINTCNLADIVILSPQSYRVTAIKNFLKQITKPALLDMPIEARGADIEILINILKEDLFDGYVANNIYALELCKDKKILLGIGMNILSSNLNLPSIMSIECADLEGSSAIYVYGKTTLMNLTHCPKRQLGYNCNNCNDCTELSLKDDLKNTFSLRRSKIEYCYLELLNRKTKNIIPK
ncbi:MAG: U32 family peptidase, partial [Clostridia bacterium]|nr:U32 family peptidase [Clostridia bacterium]